MKQYRKKGLHYTIFAEIADENCLAEAAALVEKEKATGYTYYANGTSKPLFRVSKCKESMEKALEMATQPIFHKKRAAEEVRIANQNAKAG